MWPDGWTVHHHASVASTNDLAAKSAAQGAPEGTVIWADTQSAGRGRLGRHWSSPKGNLYCSVVLRPGADLSVAGNLSFVVAVALRAAIAQACPTAEPVLKWPNDILVGGKKISGILLESGTEGGPHVVAGTGVNVANTPTDLDAAVTSLDRQGFNITPADLLSRYLNALSDRLGTWRQAGFAPVRQEWLTHCRGLGQPITVRTERETITGIFESLDLAGALVLRREDGGISTFLAADIYFNGPTPMDQAPDRGSE